MAIVLNGIVENYRELKESLAADGHTFTSQTDAEVVTHLVERHYDGDLVDAVRKAYAELEGHFSFVVIHHDHPDSNFGVTPALWDVLLGTHYPRKPHPHAGKA